MNHVCMFWGVLYACFVFHKIEKEIAENDMSITFLSTCIPMCSNYRLRVISTTWLRREPYSHWMSNFHLNAVRVVGAFRRLSKT